MSESYTSLKQNIDRTLEKFELDDQMLLNRDEVINYFKSEIISTVGDFNDPYLVLFLFFGDKNEMMFKHYVKEKMNTAFLLDKPQHMLDSNLVKAFELIKERGVEQFKIEYA